MTERQSVHPPTSSQGLRLRAEKHALNRRKLVLAWCLIGLITLPVLVIAMRSLFVTINAETTLVDADERLLKAIVTSAPIEDISALLNTSPQLARHVSSNGRTALFAAVLFDRADLIELLVEAGAPANARERLGSRKGGTALHLAVERGQIDVVAALLRSGARTDIRTVDGWSARDIAVANRRKDIELLLSNYR